MRHGCPGLPIFLSPPFDDFFWVAGKSLPTGITKWLLHNVDKKTSNIIFSFLLISIELIAFCWN